MVRYNHTACALFITEPGDVSYLSQQTCACCVYLSQQPCASWVFTWVSSHVLVVCLLESAVMCLLYVFTWVSSHVLVVCVYLSQQPCACCVFTWVSSHVLVVCWLWVFRVQSIHLLYFSMTWRDRLTTETSNSIGSENNQKCHAR